MAFVIREVSKTEFEKLSPEEIKAFVDQRGIYVAKHFYPEDVIMNFRGELARFAQKEEASWHPLYDDCPDYHRIIDEYPNAYIKGRTHSFLLNLWYEHNKKLIEIFRYTFELKAPLLGEPNIDYVSKNIPSDGFISRVLVHQYPRGGGYLKKHTDPVNEYNPIQTLVQASHRGKDYYEGGLFVEDPEDGERMMLDEMAELGDLLIFNQQVPHGVLPIDPDEPLTWSLEGGRWLILPISTRSDYVKDQAENPVQV